MATQTDRARAIGNALLNRVVADAELVRCADAIIANQMKDPASFTVLQKAEAFLAFGREAYLAQLRQYEGRLAADAASANAFATINNAFKEAP